MERREETRRGELPSDVWEGIRSPARASNWSVTGPRRSVPDATKKIKIDQPRQRRTLRSFSHRMQVWPIYNTTKRLLESIASPENLPAHRNDQPTKAEPH